MKNHELLKAIQASGRLHIVHVGIKKPALKSEPLKRWVMIRNDFTGLTTRVDTSKSMTSKRALKIRRRLCADDCTSGDVLGGRGQQDDDRGYRDLLNRAEIAVLCGRTN